MKWKVYMIHYICNLRLKLKIELKISFEAFFSKFIFKQIMLIFIFVNIPYISYTKNNKKITKNNKKITKK